LFKAARKPEEILVFLDPPEEKAEGDTDRDSGIFVQNDQAFFIPNFLLLTFFLNSKKNCISNMFRCLLLIAVPLYIDVHIFSF
jgi:hypothetical protein